MGIPGFTKFVNDRAHLFFQTYELHDCTLIIDGHSISCQLFNWNHWKWGTRSIYCYGGDYDKYAQTVKYFFNMLKDVKVRPIVVFDGGFEQRKLPTILKRMQNVIKNIETLDPYSEKRQPNKIVYPLFLREVFKDCLRSLDITMVMCEYEGDTAIASIARSLNCPVLTFDSDYFLFGALYIPFSTLNQEVTTVNQRNGSYKCIKCQIYDIKRFLHSFEGLQENTLHLLPVLLGNDYIDEWVLKPCLKSVGIDVQRSKQDVIKIILEWLAKESPEAAITKLLNYFKSFEEKLFILNKIEKIVSSYYFSESEIFAFLNIKANNDRQDKQIDFTALKDSIKNAPGSSESHSIANESIASKSDQVATNIPVEKSENVNPAQKEENVNTEGAIIFEGSHLEKENVSENQVPNLFKENFTKCLYPSSFMDIITQNKFYCIPQVENYTKENSHIISFDILRSIHKILTKGNKAEFTIVSRDKGSEVKCFLQEDYSEDLPSIEEIGELTLQNRRETLFQILKLDNAFVTILEQFSNEWHTFLISLKFALSKVRFETPLIFALIISFITLNYIDHQIGYHRSSDQFRKRYEHLKRLYTDRDHTSFKSGKNCFYHLPKRECLIFMQKIIHFFSMNPKEDSRTYDRDLIHQMTQIQSVFLHLKYLNALLKCPYSNLTVHKIMDSTLIYNLTKMFRNSNDLDENINAFFKECPCFLVGLRYVLRKESIFS